MSGSIKRQGDGRASNPAVTTSTAADVAVERDGDGNMRGRARVEMYSGPLPDPSTMAAYDDDTRKAIVEVWREEVKHRQAIEHRAMDQDHDAQKEQAIITKRGQAAGLTIGVAGLIAAVCCAWFEAPVVAGVIAGIDLLGMVTFFAGRRSAARRAVRAEEQPSEPPPAPSRPPKKR